MAQAVESPFLSGGMGKGKARLWLVFCKRLVGTASRKQKKLSTAESSVPFIKGRRQHNEFAIKIVIIKSHSP